MFGLRVLADSDKDCQEKTQEAVERKTSTAKISFKERTEMLIGIIGGLGSGKTLTMTMLGKLASQVGQDVSSNYHITFSNLRVITKNDFDNFRNGVMLLDELWLWSDSRRAMSDKNYIVNKIPLSSRKRKLAIIWTSQQLSQIDLRIRNITDVLLYPQLQIVRDSNGNPIIYKDGKQMTICNVACVFTSKKRTKHFCFLANDIFNLYDTDEEVKDLRTNSEGLKKWIKE